MSRARVEFGGVEFLAIEPRDCVMIRRGGVIVWAKEQSQALRPLQAEATVSIATAGFGRPPQADVLLISPAIADARRREEVLAAVSAVLWPLRLAAE